MLLFLARCCALVGIPRHPSLLSAGNIIAEAVGSPTRRRCGGLQSVIPLPANPFPRATAPQSARVVRAEQAPSSSGAAAASFTVVDISIIPLKQDADNTERQIVIVITDKYMHVTYEEDATQQHNADVNTSRDVSTEHSQGGVHELSNDPMHEPAYRKEDGDGTERCFEAMEPRKDSAGPSADVHMTDVIGAVA
ncbi:unnamed protein product [Urochloa humidicola]